MSASTELSGILAAVTTPFTTQGAVDLARHAEQVGADAIMVVPPFYDPLAVILEAVGVLQSAGAEPVATA